MHIFNQDCASQMWADLQSEVMTAASIALSLRVDASRSYYPKLALMVLAIEGQEGKVGELCLLEPPSNKQSGSGYSDGFMALLKTISKRPFIMHGGAHAMALLQRETAFPFSFLIDTQEAALLLAYPRTGLHFLLESLFSLSIPKLSPTSNWLHRPLGEDAVAHLDASVRYLPALWRRLQREIRAQELEEELALSTQALLESSKIPGHGVDNVPDPRKYYRMKGGKALPKQGMAVLFALSHWRDKKARELDLPPLAIFSNAQLLDIAASPQRALERLQQERFHSRLVHSDQKSLIVTIELALRDAPQFQKFHNETKQPDEHVKRRMKRLKAFRRQEAERRQVSLEAILPASVLKSLAYEPEQSLEEVKGLGKSRLKRYGEVIRLLLS